MGARDEEGNGVEDNFSDPLDMADTEEKDVELVGMLSGTERYGDLLEVLYG